MWSRIVHINSRSRQSSFRCITIQSTTDSMRPKIFFRSLIFKTILPINKSSIRSSTTELSYKLVSLHSDSACLKNVTISFRTSVRTQSWEKAWLKAQVDTRDSKRRLLRKRPKRRRGTSHPICKSTLSNSTVCIWPPPWCSKLQTSARTSSLCIRISSAGTLESWSSNTTRRESNS